MQIPDSETAGKAKLLGAFSGRSATTSDASESVESDAELFRSELEGVIKDQRQGPSKQNRSDPLATRADGDSPSSTSEGKSRDQQLLSQARSSVNPRSEEQADQNDGRPLPQSPAGKPSEIRRDHARPDTKQSHPQESAPPSASARLIHRNGDQQGVVFSGSLQESQKGDAHNTLSELSPASKRGHEEELAALDAMQGPELEELRRSRLVSVGPDHSSSIDVALPVPAHSGQVDHQRIQSAEPRIVTEESGELETNSDSQGRVTRARVIPLDLAHQKASTAGTSGAKVPVEVAESGAEHQEPTSHHEVLISATKDIGNKRFRHIDGTAGHPNGEGLAVRDSLAQGVEMKSDRHHGENEGSSHPASRNSQPRSSLAPSDSSRFEKRPSQSVETRPRESVEWSNEIRGQGPVARTGSGGSLRNQTESTGEPNAIRHVSENQTRFIRSTHSSRPDANPTESTELAPVGRSFGENATESESGKRNIGDAPNAKNPNGGRSGLFEQSNLVSDIELDTPGEQRRSRAGSAWQELPGHQSQAQVLPGSMERNAAASLRSGQELRSDLRPISSELLDDFESQHVDNAVFEGESGVRDSIKAVASSRTPEVLGGRRGTRGTASAEDRKPVNSHDHIIAIAEPIADDISPDRSVNVGERWAAGQPATVTGLSSRDIGSLGNFDTAQVDRIVDEMGDSKPSGLQSERQGARQSLEVIEKVRHLISEKISILERSENQSIKALLRPDEGTQLSLKMLKVGGATEVIVQVERGEFRGLNHHWSQLQEQMAQQDVRLAPLKDGSESFHPGHSSSAEEWEKFGTGGELKRDFGESRQHAGDADSGTENDEESPVLEASTDDREETLRTWA